MTLDEREDAWLRAAFAAPLPAAESAADAASCPAPERVWEAVHGGLPASEMREVVEHVALCAACAEEWRLAMALGAGGEAGRSAEAAALRRPGPRLWLGVAAVLLTGVLGVQVYRTQQERTQPPVNRQPVQERIQTLVPESTPLSRADCLLRWTPVRGARSYDVVVRAADLTPVVAARDLIPSELRVEPSALRGVKPGQKIFWQVTANLDGGGQTTSTFIHTLQ
jgi:hypothetical protein